MTMSLRLGPFLVVTFCFSWACPSGAFVPVLEAHNSRERVGTAIPMYKSGFPAPGLESFNKTITLTCPWYNEIITERHIRCRQFFGDANLPLLDQCSDDYALYLTYESLFGVPRKMLQYHAAVLLETSHPRRWWQESHPWEMLGGGPKWEPKWGQPKRSDFHTWSLPRGSDVFIQGLGRFDIAQAYHRLVERRWRRHKEEVLVIAVRMFRDWPELHEIPGDKLIVSCEYDAQFHSALQRGLERFRQRKCGPGDCCDQYNSEANSLERRILLGLTKNLFVAREHHCRELPYWYVSLLMLRLEGYFPELQAGSRDDARIPFEKYEDLISTYLIDDGMDLDRLRKCHTIDAILTAKGSNGYAHFIRHQKEWKTAEYWESMSQLGPHLARARMPRSTMLSLPPKQLIAWNRRHVWRFAYLDGLHDTPQLKVLRSVEAILQVADELFYFARRYCGAVQRRECVLVVQYDLEDKHRPIALGEYCLREFYWAQIECKDKTADPKQVLQVYEEYTSALQRWRRTAKNAEQAKDRMDTGTKKAAKLVRVFGVLDIGVDLKTGSVTYG